MKSSLLRGRKAHGDAAAFADDRVEIERATRCPHTLAQLRQAEAIAGRRLGAPRIESDAFIERDSNQTPAFPVLDALRSLSAEGRCFFVLAGFWKLFEMANLGYFAPIRNFGETLTLGPLEPQACRGLVRDPMQTIGVRYADDQLIDKIVEQTGRRPNLIQIVTGEPSLALFGRKDAFLVGAADHPLDHAAQLRPQRPNHRGLAAGTVRHVKPGHQTTSCMRGPIPL